MMEEMLRNVIVGDLLEIYGSLLTKRQEKLMDLHYNQDLSLGEIAEQENISRQAVHDALKRGEKSLKLFEEQLHVLANRRMIREKLPAVIEEISAWTLNEAEEAARAKIIMIFDQLIKEES